MASPSAAFPLPSSSDSQSYSSSSFDTKFRHLEALLAWNPQRLEKAPGHTSSEKTREPAFWDMHLKDDIILKNVVHMPALIKTLGALVDDSLSKLQNDGKLSALCDQLGDFDPDVPSRKMRDEKDVVDFYKETTAVIGKAIASALEFQGADSLLTWTTSHRHGEDTRIADDTGSEISNKTGGQNAARKGSRGTRNKKQSDTPVTSSSKAIADGFLRLHLDSPYFSESVSSLAADQQENVELIRQHFVNLAIWEFKSLLAGEEKIMDAIGALAGKPFPWRKCSPEHTCSNATHQEVDGLPKVTTLQTGPDATDVPWKFPIPDVTNAQKADAGSIPSSPRVKKCGEKRKHEKQSTSLSPEQKALYIVQQAWAEAVRSDATIIIIQAGNLEFIGIRHRASQTLYLSGLLDIPNAVVSGPNGQQQTGVSYAKIHTGLYIAALRDTMDRGSQISKYEKNKPYPYIGVLKEFSAPAPHAAYNNPREFLEGCHEVGISVRYFDGDKPRQTTKFFRDLRSFEDDLFQKSDDPHTRVIIAFGRQRMGSVFEAKITLNGRSLISKAIVKSAVGLASWPRLEQEYSVCLALARRGVTGIVSTLGLYENVGRMMKVLVMEDGGIPFTGEEPTNARLRDSFRKTLTEIHQAGYLHNGLKSENLLVSSSNKVSTCVVGFADCVLVAKVGDGIDEAVNRELNFLSEVLKGHDLNDEEPTERAKRRLGE